MFLSFSYHSFSQVRFGGKVGVNYSNLGKIGQRTNFSVDNKFILNYHFGFILEYDLFERISINIESLWNVKGGRRVVTVENEPPSKIRLQYNYLSLPIYGKFSIRKFNLIIGAEPSLYTSGSLKYVNTGRRSLKNSALRPEGFDLSGLMGMSISLNRYSIGLIYLHGLIGTFTYPPYVSNGLMFSKTKEYNRVLHLSVSFLIEK